MREKKFRAFVEGQDGTYICYYSDPLYPHIFWNQDYKGIFDTDPNQYTGLKDINGKEVYDGDIIEFEGFYSVVYYNENSAAFKVKELSGLGDIFLGDVTRNRKIELIGNIYQNLELMEKKS